MSKSFMEDEKYICGSKLPLRTPQANEKTLLPETLKPIAESLVEQN